MSTNQYSGYDPQDIPCTQAGNYVPQATESAHRLKKLCRELERTNDLLRFTCYALLQCIREREGAFGYDCTALLHELEPRKRKRKKHDSAIFGGLW